MRTKQAYILFFACEVLIPDLESMYGVSRDGDVQLPMFSLQLAMYDQNGWNTAPLPKNGDGRYGAAADFDLTIRVADGRQYSDFGIFQRDGRWRDTTAHGVRYGLCRVFSRIF